jgi:hypothetical protein
MLEPGDASGVSVTARISHGSLECWFLQPSITSRYIDAKQGQAHSRGKCLKVRAGKGPDWLTNGITLVNR